MRKLKKVNKDKKQETAEKPNAELDKDKKSNIKKKAEYPTLEDENITPPVVSDRRGFCYYFLPFGRAAAYSFMPKGAYTAPQR